MEMENERIKLWAHCVSGHAMRLSPEISIVELKKCHESEHAGPCTIRNHDKNNRAYNLRKIGLVLSET